MSDLEKKQLAEFSKYIEQILRPSYIRGFMVEYLGAEEVERILSKEETSVTYAAQMLLRKMQDLEEIGWFQAFLDALKAAEYTGLYEAIQEWNFAKIEELKQHKLVLERIEASFTKNIKPVEIIAYMLDCLTLRECEEIKAIDAQKGPIAASEKLTECLKRSDKSNWFKLLTLALKDCGFRFALDLLDPDSDGKCVEEMDTDDGQTFSIQYREEADTEGIVNSDNLMVPPGNFHHSAADCDAKPSPRESLGKKELREYQRELAEPAFRGENTIICAPTGCGKTLVALAICENHLKSKPNGAKIVFLATKVDVFAQQYKLFQDHFRNGDEVVRITGLCGEVRDLTSMDVLIESYDIIVLTPQILVNALKNKELPDLCVFTLLIFDECHNTTRKHPYNMLMASYLDSKFKQANIRLPQIVGLTASVGIGTFKNHCEAENNICQLCGNLDVRIISTVKKNIEELRSFVHIPEKEFYVVEKPANDPFVSIICKIMSSIENLAKEVHDIESMSNIPHEERGTQMYEQWIVEVQKGCKTLNLEDKEKESIVCRALFNYTENLRKYNDALIIKEDARTKDCLNYLESFFQEVRQAGFDETEQKLTAYFDEQRSQLVQLSESEEGENPKLKELKFILDEQYRSNDQTRTLLFVRTRALADAMKNWIEDTESLKFLKPGILIGRRSDISGSGMTLSSQKGVLESFKNTAQRKILIATSVADEGIDIPQCNLVLMYEYIGNVVKMVQVRGRGRAEGSKCILVSSKKERIEKEKRNVNQEKIVEKAVCNLQESQKSMLSKIEVFQNEDKARRDLERLNRRGPLARDNNRLLCSKCKSFSCYSDVLRVLQESHHVVLDKTIFDRCITKPHDKPKTFGNFGKKMKMFCKSCQQDWGIIASYLNIEDLPVIKIDSFVVENCETQEQRYYRKWKDVPFAMKAFNIAEIKPR